MKLNFFFYAVKSPYECNYATAVAAEVVAAVGLQVQYGPALGVSNRGKDLPKGFRAES